MPTTFIEISKIKIECGTQTRAGLHEETIQEYCERMQAGDKFPPVVVFYDGNNYMLADGFHRLMASIRIHTEKMECEVRKGSRRDAIEFAIGANRTNGQRRTDADKRYCVTVALQEFKEWSNRVIAEKCGVSAGLVDKLRKELPTIGNTQPDKRKGVDGKAYKATKSTAKPTKKPQAKPEALEPIETPEPEDRPHIRTADEEMAEAPAEPEKPWEHFGATEKAYALAVEAKSCHTVMDLALAYVCFMELCRAGKASYKEAYALIDANE